MNVPPDTRSCRSIAPYTSHRPTSLRGEVVFTMKILHRDGFFEPIDDCKQRCLAEMKQKLGDLGAHQGN